MDVADVAIRCQAVDVARKISTVWRTVATGERWLWENGGYGRMVDVADVAIRCQAVEVGESILSGERILLGVVALSRVCFVPRVRFC